MSDSLRPHGLYSPWNSPGQNTGVGSLPLLQEIFPTQGLNPGLPHCRRILYQLSHKGSPRILEWVAYPFCIRSSKPRNQTGVFCTEGRVFTNWATREAQKLQSDRQMQEPDRTSPTALVINILSSLPPLYALHSPWIRLPRDLATSCSFIWIDQSDPSLGTPNTLSADANKSKYTRSCHSDSTMPWHLKIALWGVPSTSLGPSLFQFLFCWSFVE